MNNKEGILISKDGEFEFNLGKFGELFDLIATERGWSEVSTKAQWTKCSNFAETTPERKSNGRELNELNTMLNEARKYVTCGGEECVEVDFKACFVTLITTLMKGSEKVQWKALLRVGFYERVALKLCVTEGEAKKQVNCFIGGMSNTRFEREILDVYFPQLAKRIRGGRLKKGSNALVLYCTKLEGHIVLGVIEELDVPVRSLHDGIFCRKSDRELVREALEKKAEEVLGFMPRIEYK